MIGSDENVLFEEREATRTALKLHIALLRYHLLD